MYPLSCLGCYSVRVKKTYTLSLSKEALGKSLGRNSSNAFMRHASHDQTLKRSMLRELCRMLRADMMALLASPDFMKKDVNSLRNFSWDGLYNTMKHKAPTLVELLQSCIPQSSTRKKFVMVICAALLAATHKHCTSVQSYVSIVLYLGHAAKQVSSLSLIQFNLHFVLLIGVKQAAETRSVNFHDKAHHRPDGRKP